MTDDPHGARNIPVGTPVVGFNGAELGYVREIHPHYILIAADRPGSAGASAAGVAVVAAGTRVHGGDQCKSRHAPSLAQNGRWRTTLNTQA